MERRHATHSQRVTSFDMSEQLVSPILMLCAGGHSRVLLESISKELRSRIIGVIDPHLKVGSFIYKNEVLGDDSYALNTYRFDQVLLINGLGCAGSTVGRRRLFEKYKCAGFNFFSVIHARAYVSESAKLAEGVQVMAGALIQSGAIISDNTIVNTGSIIDHDCRIGSHVHVAPGATLSGGVYVGDGVHIGTGAKVIQGIKIDCDAVIAAGAVVVRDVKQGETVMGVPAKFRSDK